MSEKKDTWIKKALRRLFLIYMGIAFFIVFILLFPLFLLIILFKKKKLGLVLTRHLTTLFYFLIGIRIEVENKHFLDKKSTYIFCPNHFSFLDITTMPQVPKPFKFVGKESLSKIPGFGYYFKNFHIMVDRDNPRSSIATFKESIQALRDGVSLTVFPEGGIEVGNTIELSEFKEGPFRMALKTGVHLVPVTIADNWRILPDDGKFKMSWKRKSRVIIHEPIDPSKYDSRSVNEFQEVVRNTIQKELHKRNSVG
ncbi:MAG: lysophospholipid acyltransferase family protein [Ekhidna sp.]